MTVTAKTLLEALQITIGATAQYTAPVNTRAIIDKMTVTNTTGAAATFTAYLVPAAGASGAGNKVISAQTIAPGVSYLCPEIVGHILNPGDFIVTESSAVALTVRISGREVN